MHVVTGMTGQPPAGLMTAPTRVPQGPDHHAGLGIGADRLRRHRSGQRRAGQAQRCPENWGRIRPAAALPLGQWMPWPASVCSKGRAELRQTGQDARCFRSRPLGHGGLATVCHRFAKGRFVPPGPRCGFAFGPACGGTAPAGFQRLCLAFTAGRSGVGLTLSRSSRRPEPGCRQSRKTRRPDRVIRRLRGQAVQPRRQWGQAGAGSLRAGGG